MRAVRGDVRVCPECGRTKGMRVADSGIKDGKPWIYRRRVCQFCGASVGSYEISVDELKEIMSKNDDIERLFWEITKLAEERRIS